MIDLSLPHFVFFAIEHVHEPVIDREGLELRILLFPYPKHCLVTLLAVLLQHFEDCLLIEPVKDPSVFALDCAFEEKPVVLNRELIFLRSHYQLRCACYDLFRGHGSNQIQTVAELG